MTIEFADFGERIIWYSEDVFWQLQDLYDLSSQRHIQIANAFRFGLRFKDMQDVAMALLMYKFLINIFKKNLVTAFVILGICIATTYIWHCYLEQVVEIWDEMWQFCPYYKRLSSTSARLADNAEYYGNLHFTHIQKKLPHWWEPHMLVYYTVASMFKQLDPDTMTYYRKDPISMVLGEINLGDRSPIVFYYYKIYNVYIPGFNKAAKEVWFSVKNGAEFTFITRVGKKNCPYFLRWHYTFILLYEMIMQISEKLVIRAIWYWQEGVYNGIGHLNWEDRCREAASRYQEEPEYPSFEAAGRMMVNTKIRHLIQRPWDEAFKYWNYDRGPEMDKLIFYNKLLLTGSRWIMCLHMAGVMFGMFHAALGQYMYVPFITENVEKHVEPRDKNSKYSCGYTAWQDIPVNVRARMFPPKYWWGWFGRGTDRENIFLYIPKQLLKMVLRKIRNLLRVLKRRM